MMAQYDGSTTAGSVQFVADPVVVDVVGIGADGWAGLAGASRRLIRQAPLIVGSPRQLGLLPADEQARGVRLPSPLLPGLRELLDDLPGDPPGVVVLGSGDPSWHGIATTLIRWLGPDRVRTHPHPSSLSLACARLGWAVQEVTTVHLLTEPVELLVPHLTTGRRLVVLGAGRRLVADVADLLCRKEFGASAVIVLSDLGATDEQVRHGTARRPPPAGPALTLVAVDCRPDRPTSDESTVPGLPDDSFDHDGQLSKRDVRASALAHLRPRPGELLWDVGAGAASIAVEWMRHHRSCRAVAVERDPGRADRITANARALGVPHLQVLVTEAPAGLGDLPAPDAVFVGGGVTAPGLLEAAWSALREGGRLVAHAVTAESETVLLDARRRHGGELTRIRVEHLQELGRFSTWRSALPVTQWSAVRPRPGRPG